MIPHHLSYIIWAALTDVTNIQVGRTRLQEVFTQPPFYDDYLNTIKSHKKYTAPGMTGLSYRHLKTLPEDLHKATYNMLCTLWPTQYIPDYWKQRLWGPGSESNINNQLQILSLASVPPQGTISCPQGTRRRVLPAEQSRQQPQ